MASDPVTITAFELENVKRIKALRMATGMDLLTGLVLGSVGTTHDAG